MLKTFLKNDKIFYAQTVPLSGICCDTEFGTIALRFLFPCYPPSIPGFLQRCRVQKKQKPFFLRYVKNCQGLMHTWSVRSRLKMCRQDRFRAGNVIFPLIPEPELPGNPDEGGPSASAPANHNHGCALLQKKDKHFEDCII